MEEKKTVGQKVKGHFKKHKAKYITGGLVVAGVGVGVFGHKLYSDKKFVKLNESVKELNSNVKDLINLNSSTNSTGDISAVENSNVEISMGNNITNIIQQLERSGEAGNVVYCYENDTFYSSQRKAEKALTLYKGGVSKQLSGELNSVNGFTFKKYGDFNSDQPRMFEEAS